MCISALLIVEPNTIAPFLIISPSFHTSLFPIIRPSGLSVGGIFPVRVILPAWPVWHEELADAATGLPADFTMQCGMAAQSLLSWPLQRRFKDFSHVLLKGSGRTCWQSRANKTLLVTDSARSRYKHAHTHTLASRNLDDGALEWSDKTILLHK